ncbi:MAG: arsenite methyltransferase [Limnochordia bacterium]
MAKEDIRARIREDYGRIARQEGTGCCCNCDCSTGSTDLLTVAKKLGYSAEELANIPKAASLGLGCGNPLALLSLREGQTVLDLGSGAGFDCFLAREKVGETGQVIGVDMTPEMVELARRNAESRGYDNVQFLLGEIEDLPLEDDSVDVIISNCVVNLSPDKASVFREAHRVLRPGGKLCIADVVATAEIPPEIKGRLDLISGCLAGAARVEEIEAFLLEAGFVDVRMSAIGNSDEVISGWALGKQATSFLASYIIEAYKP